MDIASKLKSKTVCICRHEFWTDFLVRSIQDQISANLWIFRKKKSITSGFSKNAKMFHGLGQDFFCIKFLVVSDFEALFK